MKQQITSFLSDDSAAVTVDWVVLSAALVGVAVAAILVFNDGTRNLATSLSESLGEQEIEMTLDNM